MLIKKILILILMIKKEDILFIYGEVYYIYLIIFYILLFFSLIILHIIQVLYILLIFNYFQISLLVINRKEIHYLYLNQTVYFCF